MKTIATFAVSLALVSSRVIATDGRYVTLAIGNTTNWDAQASFQIQTDEVVHFVAGHDPKNTFRVNIQRDNLSWLFYPSDLQTVYYAPKSIVLTGPATVTLLSLWTRPQPQDSCFATFKITPEAFPPDRTLMLPPGTNQVQVMLESSTNLLEWSIATNGIYGRPDEARFFRIRGLRLSPAP